MVIKDLKKFAKHNRLEKLSAAEKQAMRKVLFNFMEQNPAVRNETTVRQILAGGLSRNLIRSKFMPVALIIAVMIAVSGATSLAAEQAVPGDLLYPVKISINENVHTALNFSTDAKAEWAIDKVARRLEEAEKLKVQERLNAATSADLQGAIATAAEMASSLAAESGDFDRASSVHSRLEAVLKGHAQILLSLTDGDQNVVDILLNVVARTKAAQENRVEAEGKISTDTNDRIKAAASGKMRAAKQKIDEVEKFISRVSVSLSASAQAQADAQFQDAVDAYAEGEVKMKEELYHKAFVKFQEALRLAEEAKIIVATANRLDVELRFDFEDRSDDSAASDYNDGQNEDQGRGDNSNRTETKMRLPLNVSNLIDAANQANEIIKTEIKIDDDNSDDGSSRRGRDHEEDDESAGSVNVDS